MTTKVAVVRIREDYTSALLHALEAAGGIEDINLPERDVCLKVGIFDPRSRNHASVPVVGAICAAFDRAPRVRLVESDNYCGKAIDRLTCYEELFDGRVEPASLSEGCDMRSNMVAGEEMPLAGVMFKPNVFVSAHLLRTFQMGSVLKNLFGCTPMVKKARFHKKELFTRHIADICQAIGGIDLAVMDGTCLYHNAAEKHIRVGVLLAGRDAVAVETVGAALAGIRPERVALIQEFNARGLGECDLSKIEIVGIAEDEYAQLKLAHKELKKLIAAEPRGPGISGTIDKLVEEGWMASDRSLAEVVAALDERGVKAKDRVVSTTLKRRAGKTIERVKEAPGWIYRRKPE